MQIDNKKSPAPPLPAATAIELPLSAAARGALRARAQILDPVVMISTNGLSDAVLGEIDRSLNHHALIKIRVQGADRLERAALLEQICARTGAAPIQHIGKVLIVYRPCPEPADEEAPRIVKPAASAGKRAVAPPKSRPPATVIRRRRIPTR
ncbi:MAG: YhbY family RNA-binding protein [Burkholderiales bacterium]